MSILYHRYPMKELCMKKIVLSLILCVSTNPILSMDMLLEAIAIIRSLDNQKNSYGLVEMIGLRSTMEDETDVQIARRHAFFAVYDGHGGQTVATLAKHALYKKCNLDEAKSDEDIKAALRKGFSTFQAELSDQLEWIGSTATIAVIKNGKIFVANVGDSRTVLSSKSSAIALSQDHKPDREDEEKRIKEAGGSVHNDNGIWRVQGMLSTSRALGDKGLRPYVISDPEITITELNDEHEFLILACDGIWDVMKNEEAVCHVKGILDKYDGDCTRAARSLAHHALNVKGSRDNVSAIVVNLKPFIQK